MAKHKEEKTNVMRVLDQKKIPYTAHTYDPESGIDGVSVARSLGQDPASVFKTLVARGASGGYYVFDIPVAATLDLKKAAHAVGEKSVAMLPQKELLPLTGYVHGGCSPVGMKKQFPTVFHETAELFDTICVSAGELSDSDKASTASCAGFFNSAGRRLASPPVIDSATSAAAVRSLPLFPDTPEMKDSMKSTAVSTISGAWDAASTAKSAKMFPASFTADFRPPFLKAFVISPTA